MDKLVYYSVFDCSGSESISFRIMVRGFPVVELLEFDVGGVWVSDESSLGILEDGFRGSLLSFLDDDNMRIILDIMADGDVFVSGRYSLRIVVDSLEILD